MATLRISSSKMGPAGRSAARTHSCICGGERIPSCPLCAASHLLGLAMASWGGDRHSQGAKFVPLIGTMAAPHRFVSKQALVAAAQSDAELIRSLGIAEVIPAEVTGHFMRRSGAKAWARSGFSLATVQWLGRWGSSAVMLYVEEAAEELAPGVDHRVPLEVVRSDAAVALRWAPRKDESRSMLSVLGEPEVKQGLVEAGVVEDRLEALEQFAVQVRGEIGGARALAQELEELVRPSFVLNTSSEVLHKAVRTERLSPVLASTVCGWMWARSPLSRPVPAEEEAGSGPLWGRCARCFPSDGFQGRAAGGD